MKTDTQTNTDTDTWTQHTDTHPAMPYLPSSLLASVFSALFYVNQRRFVLGNLKFETLTFEILPKKSYLGKFRAHGEMSHPAKEHGENPQKEINQPETYQSDVHQPDMTKYYDHIQQLTSRPPSW